MSRKLMKIATFLRISRRKYLDPIELKSPKKVIGENWSKWDFLWTWAKKGSEKRKFGGIWKSMIKTYYGKNPQN